MEPSVENEGGQRDDILQLRAQLNLLKELNQLKDERMQELAVRSNVEQVKLQEEGAQLAQDNSALREVVHGLNRDVLRLEHEVDGLKSANNEPVQRITYSHKLRVSEGTQTLTPEAPREASDLQLLKEKHETLRAEYEELHNRSRIYQEENTKLSGDVARLNVVVESKDEVINAWKKMGEVWQEEKSEMQHQLKDVNQRLLQVGASKATVASGWESPPSLNLGRSSVSMTSQAASIPQDIMSDRRDHDVTTMHFMPPDTAPSSPAPVKRTQHLLRSSSRSILRDNVATPHSAPAGQDIVHDATVEDTSAVPDQNNHPPLPPPSSQATPNPLPAPPAMATSSTIVASVETSVKSNLDPEFDGLITTITEPGPDTEGVSLKRKRGRPKGSKNKKGSVASRAALNPDAPKKKRGRPPKNKGLQGLGLGGPLPSLPDLVKRKRGRPFKFRDSADGGLGHFFGSHPVRTQAVTVVRPQPTRTEEASGSSGPGALLDPRREDTRPEGVLTTTDVSKKQLPLLAGESVHHRESDTSFKQNSQESPPEMNESHKLDTSKKIKLEPNETLGLNQHHIELIYQMANERLFCKLCARSKVPGTPVVSFHVGTPHQRLLEHCSVEHPHECARLVRVSPEQLGEMRNRMLAD